MRKVFTLIFFLTILKLSAAALNADSVRTAGTDSLKKASAKAVADSIKKRPQEHSDSLNTTAINHLTDSAKTGTPVNNIDSLKLTASLPQVKTDKPDVGENKAKNDIKPDADARDNAAVADDANLRPITSLVQLDSLRATLVQEQLMQAQLRKLALKNEQIKIAALLKINNLDSLKQELKVTTSDTLKAILNTRIALKYLNYDTIANKDRQYYYQNEAINYTLQAIREYSIYNDSIGLRLCYDNLAKVYHAQKKFAQAKWFILQSNTLSRAKNDTPNIITSLLTLAAIKSDIKDYTLAMGDLNEALSLSKTNHTPKTELEILKNYAQLYNLLQNYPKESAVLKRRDSLLDSIRKSDEALLAKMAAQKKKQEMLQNKKKLYTTGIRKSSKNSSPPKIASL